MKYRKALTGAVLVPAFIFLGGVGLIDEASADPGKSQSSKESKSEFKSEFKAFGTSFKPSEIEQPKIEQPSAFKGGFSGSGSGSNSKSKKSTGSKSSK